MKEQIRQQVLEERSQLSSDQRRAKSAEIETRLFGLPEFQAAAIVMFFASFRSEVDTHPMIRKALAEGKRVVLPKVKGRDLELFEIFNFDRDASPGAWGIPEPGGPGVRPADLKDLGLIVVPGAAFDEQGNRLGYGGGFYDRLLPRYGGRTVALAFELQVIPGVPASKHDIPIQRIVTEERVISAGSSRS